MQQITSLLQDAETVLSAYPIKDRYVPGSSNLVLVLGENASGKSLYRKIVHGVCSGYQLECLHFSMEARSAAGIPRMFIYGDEQEASTG